MRKEKKKVPRGYMLLTGGVQDDIISQGILGIQKTRSRPRTPVSTAHSGVTYTSI